MGKQKNNNKKGQDVNNSSNLETKKTALQMFADWMALTSNPEEVMEVTKSDKAIVFRRVDEEEKNNSDQE